MHVICAKTHGRLSVGSPLSCCKHSVYLFGIRFVYVFVDIKEESMKHVLLSLRTIFRFKTYTGINIAGLALSLACVFILVRYIHQEMTVNHFVPELDRTFLTAEVKEDGSARLIRMWNSEVRWTIRLSNDIAGSSCWEKTLSKRVVLDIT